MEEGEEGEQKNGERRGERRERERGKNMALASCMLNISIGRLYTSVPINAKTPPHTGTQAYAHTTASGTHTRMNSLTCKQYTHIRVHICMHTGRGTSMPRRVLCYRDPLLAADQVTSPCWPCPSQWSAREAF